MIRDLYLGFIRIHILYHAAKEPIYGLYLMEELGRHGYNLSPGTLYPILHKMEKADFLKSYAEQVDGKIRRYYKITALGKKSLVEAKKRVHELVKEIED
jgi:PadR family transcriptional regulator PadR